MSAHSQSPASPALSRRSSSVVASPAGHAQDPDYCYSPLPDTEMMCGAWETQPLSVDDYDQNYLLKAYDLDAAIPQVPPTEAHNSDTARANLFVQRVLDLAKISARIACELQDEHVQQYNYARVYKDLATSFDQVTALLPFPPPLQTAETLDSLVPQLVPLLRKPLLDSLRPRLLKDLRQPMADELSIPLQDAIDATLSVKQDSLCAQLHQPLLDHLETSLDQMLARKLANVRGDLEGTLGFSLLDPLTSSVYHRLHTWLSTQAPCDANAPMLPPSGLPETYTAADKLMGMPSGSSLAKRAATADVNATHERRQRSRYSTVRGSSYQDVEDEV